ncbi:hypothetical protein [Rhizomonospora bruguierae]|uniref:hypothetical protein n=1 Tax=Rhizomonospora bruguierae TaxID=1581705 RepID=UPI001BCF504D|nr:hypothetical protein [Micromonospora sp. NBRC 107566]
MQPPAADIARTLASGRLPGRLWLAALTRDIPVAHATTAAGQVLIAARRDSHAWLALASNGDDAGAILAVDDAPPFPESPRLGRVHLCGWVHRVAERDLHRAGLDFAAANPLHDLLDLGADVDLFSLELGEVRLERRDTVLLEAEQFVAATPDPLHPHERDLLQDLRDHHADELAALVPHPRGRCLPVRLDRHGLVMATPGPHRIEFSSPADCPGCVARALRLTHATDS